MPVQSTSHFRLGSGLSPLKTSQTRTPSPVAQPMFLEGSWNAGPESVVFPVVPDRVTTTVCVSASVCVSTIVCVGPTMSVGVDVSFPPPQPAAASARQNANASGRIQVSLVLHVFHDAILSATLLSRVGAKPGVFPHLERPELPLELEVALEALLGKGSCFDRLPNRAAGFVQMAAVREATLRSVARHVCEARIEDAFVGPELQLAHSGRVEEQRAPRERDKLAVRGRVPAATAFARRRGGEKLLARQAVDQRRLAHTGGSEQRDGLSAAEIRLERFEADARCGADRQNGDAERDCLDLGELFGGGLREIALVHDDDRNAAAVPRGGEVPLEPASVQVLSECSDQKERVDV